MINIMVRLDTFNIVNLMKNVSFMRACVEFADKKKSILPIHVIHVSKMIPQEKLQFTFVGGKERRVKGTKTDEM